MVKVDARILKASRIFGQYGKMIFSNHKVTRPTKARLYTALCTTISLYGCESCSEKSNMERRLLSQQTQHCATMLGAFLRERIRNRATALSMRALLGLPSVLTKMRTLQLGWLGNIRRMIESRRPRQLMTSWLNGTRLKNYNQTYSRTLLKALRSVGIREDEWHHLAESRSEWEQYISQTSEDRESLCALAAINPAHINNCLDEDHEDMICVQRRRAEFLLCGGKFIASTYPRLRDAHIKDDHLDLRALHRVNCWHPDLYRPRYISKSPEALHAQMVLEIGVNADRYHGSHLLLRLAPHAT